MVWMDSITVSTNYRRKFLGRHHQGGDSLIIWSNFSHYGRKSLVMMCGMYDLAKYCGIINDDLVLFCTVRHAQNGFINKTMLLFTVRLIGKSGSKTTTCPLYCGLPVHRT